MTMDDRIANDRVLGSLIAVVDSVRQELVKADLDQMLPAET